MIFKKIQCLRALAANGIVLSHFLIVEQKYGHGSTFLPSWVHIGSSGVDLFFIISGFIMVTIAGDVSWKNFIIPRASRIYPPYWFYTTAVLAVWMVAPSIVNDSYAHAPSIWRSYCLIPGTTPPLLAVGWTLIHEMYFYIVFAVILFTRIPKEYALASWGIAVVTLSLIFPHIDAQSSPILAILIHPLTLEFIVGAYIGIAIKSDAAKYGWQSLTAGVLLFSFICLKIDNINQLIDFANWSHVLAFGSAFSLIVYGAAACERSGWQSPQWIVALGDASYSTYLSHVLVLSVIGHAFAAQPIHGSAIEALFVFAGLMSANIWALGSYRYMEMPSLRFTRSLISHFRFAA